MLSRQRSNRRLKPRSRSCTGGMLLVMTGCAHQGPLDSELQAQRAQDAAAADLESQAHPKQPNPKHVGEEPTTSSEDSYSLTTAATATCTPLHAQEPAAGPRGRVPRRASLSHLCSTFSSSSHARSQEESMHSVSRNSNSTTSHSKKKKSSKNKKKSHSHTQSSHTSSRNQLTPTLSSSSSLQRTTPTATCSSSSSSRGDFTTVRSLHETLSSNANQILSLLEEQKGQHPDYGYNHNTTTTTTEYCSSSASHPKDAQPPVTRHPIKSSKSNSQTKARRRRHSMQPTATSTTTSHHQSRQLDHGHD